MSVFDQLPFWATLSFQKIAQVFKVGPARALGGVPAMEFTDLSKMDYFLRCPAQPCRAPQSPPCSSAQRGCPHRNPAEPRAAPHTPAEPRGALQPAQTPSSSPRLNESMNSCSKGHRRQKRCLPAWEMYPKGSMTLINRYSLLALQWAEAESA